MDENQRPCQAASFPLQIATSNIFQAFAVQPIFLRGYLTQHPPLTSRFPYNSPSVLNNQRSSDREPTTRSHLTESEREHLRKIRENIQQDRRKLRSPPRYENINCCGVPYESSFDEYKLFPNFRFATSRNHHKFTSQPCINEQDYEEGLKEFQDNGIELLDVELKEEFPPLPESIIKLDDVWNKTEMFSTLKPVNLNRSVLSTISEPTTKSERDGKRKSVQHCVFCANNGRDPEHYKNHAVRDGKGRTTCPILRRYKCPICGVNGDEAHTINYCPKKKSVIVKNFKKTPSRRNSPVTSRQLR